MESVEHKELIESFTAKHPGFVRGTFNKSLVREIGKQGNVLFPLEEDIELHKHIADDCYELPPLDKPNEYLWQFIKARRCDFIPDAYKIDGCDVYIYEAVTKNDISPDKAKRIKTLGSLLDYWGYSLWAVIGRKYKNDFDPVMYYRL